MINKLKSENKFGIGYYAFLKIWLDENMSEQETTAVLKNNGFDNVEIEFYKKKLEIDLIKE